MSTDPITVAPNVAFTITRSSISGWVVLFQSLNKNVSFTDSIDLIDWLSGVLISSDGGKQQVQKDTLETAVLPTTPPAPAGY